MSAQPARQQTCIPAPALQPSKQHFRHTGRRKDSCLPAGCLQELGSYLKEENLPLLKEYVKTCLYSDLSMMTDTASLAAAQEYQTAAGGIEKKKDFERTVSETVQEKLGFQCGRVFCETYFNEDAKQDVASIIRQIIDVYDNRLAHMEWMTESTRQEARKKLKAITVKVGYPDQWPQDKYSLVLKSPDEGGVYIDNIMEILKASQDYSFKTRHDPVDRNEWSMTPQTVNAYYNPGNNEIVFRPEYSRRLFMTRRQSLWPIWEVSEPSSATKSHMHLTQAVPNMMKRGTCGIGGLPRINSVSGNWRKRSLTTMIPWK